MLTNDLKSGTRIRLRNGWYATLKDNKRGNIRLAEVEGIFTELGSIYSHDIAKAEVNGVWVDVTHSKDQKRIRAIVKSALDS
jgi:hypothetical protein